ncbi:hypothetical protein ACFE04_016205 [Oxalis oulophora]
MNNIIQWLLCLVLFLSCHSSLANYCRRPWHRPGHDPGLTGLSKVVFIEPYRTIVVDKSGRGNFSSIQDAINFVPQDNKEWVCIYIKAGTYREQIKITYDKPYIIMKGEGKRKTFVTYGAHQTLEDSPTFASLADNIVVKAMTFIGCSIQVLGNLLEPGSSGVITSQGREHPDDGSGYVFKNCNVFGFGSAYLGRPWRPYARVLFYNSNFTDVIQPKGWDSSNMPGTEPLLSFSEDENFGPGANSTERVSWEKKLDDNEVKELISMDFINSDGWLQEQPF